MEGCGYVEAKVTVEVPKNIVRLISQDEVLLRSGCLEGVDVVFSTSVRQHTASAGGKQLGMGLARLSDPAIFFTPQPLIAHANGDFEHA